jgi:hypothetical protein
MRLLSILAIHRSASFGQNSTTITNDSLEATFNPSDSALSMRSLAEKNSIFPAGKIVNGGTVAKLVNVVHPFFGRGKAIEVMSSDGKKDEIMLYPKLPFVLIRRTITNSGAEPMVINREEVFSADLDLAEPASGLSVLSTGGFHMLRLPAKSSRCARCSVARSC